MCSLIALSLSMQVMQRRGEFLFNSFELVAAFYLSQISVCLFVLKQTLHTDKYNQIQLKQMGSSLDPGLLCYFDLIFNNSLIQEQAN